MFFKKKDSVPSGELAKREIPEEGHFYQRWYGVSCNPKIMLRSLVNDFVKSIETAELGRFPNKTSINYPRFSTLANGFKYDQPLPYMRVSNVPVGKETSGDLVLCSYPNCNRTVCDLTKDADPKCYYELKSYLMLCDHHCSTVRDHLCGSFVDIWAFGRTFNGDLDENVESEGGSSDDGVTPMKEEDDDVSFKCHRPAALTHNMTEIQLMEQHCGFGALYYGRYSQEKDRQRFSSDDDKVEQSPKSYSKWTKKCVSKFGLKNGYYNRPPASVFLDTESTALFPSNFPECKVPKTLPKGWNKFKFVSSVLSIMEVVTSYFRRTTVPTYDFKVDLLKDTQGAGNILNSIQTGIQMYDHICLVATNALLSPCVQTFRALMFCVRRIMAYRSTLFSVRIDDTESAAIFSSMIPERGVPYDLSMYANKWCVPPLEQVPSNGVVECMAVGASSAGMVGYGATIAGLALSPAALVAASLAVGGIVSYMVRKRKRSHRSYGTRTSPSSSSSSAEANEKQQQQLMSAEGATLKDLVKTGAESNLSSSCYDKINSVVPPWCNASVEVFLNHGVPRAAIFEMPRMSLCSPPTQENTPHMTQGFDPKPTLSPPVEWSATEDRRDGTKRRKVTPKQRN